MGNIDVALGRISREGGRIVLLGDYTVNYNFDTPIDITGTLYIGGKEGTAPKLSFTLDVFKAGSSLVLDNMIFSTENGVTYPFIMARYNNLTLGENFITEKRSDGYYPFVMAGYNVYADAQHNASAVNLDTAVGVSSDKDVRIELYGGTFYRFLGGNRRSAPETSLGTFSGNLEVVVDGASFTDGFAVTGMNYMTGTASITLRNMAYSGTVYGMSRAGGTASFNAFDDAGNAGGCVSIFLLQTDGLYALAAREPGIGAAGNNVVCTLHTYADYTEETESGFDEITRHQFDGGEITTPATCMEPGVKTYTCMDEGCEYLYTEPIAPLGHDLVEVEAEVAATCTTPGKTAQKRCQREGCDYSEGGETIAMLGHTWGEWVVTTPAQIGVAGEETRTCSVCHETETRPIDPLPKEPETNNKNLIVLVTSANKKEYTVRFDTVGAAKIEPQTVKKNAVAAEPETPVKAGFYFTGWYRDARYETKYDFAQPVKEDITLYAKWSEVDPRIIMTVGSTDASVFGMATITDVPPVIVNDRTMLPARFVAEALGATVTWNASERKVTILNGETGIELYIDSAAAYIDGRAVTLDSAPFIRDDRTYLPLRFIAEALGAKVDWYPETRQAVITRLDA